MLVYLFVKKNLEVNCSLALMRNKKYSQGLDVAETPTKLVYILWGTYLFSRVDYVTVYGCCVIRVLLEYG